MKGIADTGFLVAFANQNDLHHPWAVEVASRVLDPLLTCEAVLAETAFHLQSVAMVLQPDKQNWQKPMAIAHLISLTYA